MVFTLPREVADLALANPGTLYRALFQAASATLRDVAADRKWLGASVGVLLVLHTWGPNLHHHPHVHGVVTGGGLACNPQGGGGASPRGGPALGPVPARLLLASACSQSRLPGEVSGPTAPGSH